MHCIMGTFAGIFEASVQYSVCMLLKSQIKSWEVNIVHLVANRDQFQKHPSDCIIILYIIGRPIYCPY